jgi:hypothetical protein
MQFYGSFPPKRSTICWILENYQKILKGQLYSTLGVFGSIRGVGIALAGSIILLIQILLLQQESYFSLQFYPFPL